MSEIKILPMESAIAPIPKAVIHNGLVYVSGQAALDGKTMQATSPDIKEQTRETLRRIDAILAEAGTSKDKALMVRVYLTDAEKDFSAMNEVYREWVGEHRPARTTVGAPLAIPSLKIEIDVLAALD